MRRFPRDNDFGARMRERKSRLKVRRRNERKTCETMQERVRGATESEGKTKKITRRTKLRGTYIFKKVTFGI